MSIAAAIDGLRHKALRDASQYIQSRILMICFTLVLHYLTCVSTERYLTITSKTEKISTRQSKQAIVIVTIYVVLIWLVIFFNDVCLYSDSHCTSRLWFLTNKQPRETYSVHYSPNPTVTIVVISVWMTTCNTILNTTTLVTLRFIKTRLADSERRLGVSSKRFETRRLKVVHALSIFLCIIWIPYGIVSGQRDNIDPAVQQIVQVLIETVCYASFLAVPTTIYIMDKRFWLYIKSLLRRSNGVLPQSVGREMEVNQHK